MENQLHFTIDAFIKNKSILRKEYSSFSILNYNKNALRNEEVMKYRSVVLYNDKESNSSQILSFSPPKSISLELFTSKYSKNNEIIINEIIEGTMINLFYNKFDLTWVISTKTIIGGLNEVQETKTSFHDMFMDSIKVDRNTLLNDVHIFRYLAKDKSYSFVMKHPLNHIVQKVIEPELYLVAVYEIDNDKVFSIPQNVFEKWDYFAKIGGVIHFSQCFDNNITDLMCSNHFSADDCIGYMITHKSGNRTKIINSSYKNMKSLRGNNPSLHYQYLCLARMGKTTQFLSYFPCYKDRFYAFFREYKKFISNLYNAYVSQYILKDGTFITRQYLKHTYNLHNNIYIPSLQDSYKKTKITKDVIMVYLDGLSPIDLLISLKRI